jgi:hypothetical protein
MSTIYQTLSILQIAVVGKRRLNITSNRSVDDMSLTLIENSCRHTHARSRRFVFLARREGAAGAMEIAWHSRSPRRVTKMLTP